MPWWGLVSSSAAPVLLIGGWTVAAALQPSGFDPYVESISALASRDATNSWLMSLAFLGVGLCHLATAMALRPVAPAARVLLGVGGVATVAVAAFPLPGAEAHSVPHAIAATVAFVALAAWPALAASPDVATQQSAPVLRRHICVGAATVLLLLVGWFFAVVVSGGPSLGLSERIAAGAQSVWPFVVVVALRPTRQAPAARR